MKRARHALLSALLLSAPLAGAAGDSVVTGDPWPRIRKERIQKLLPQAMARANVDAWVVFCRENDNDPLAIHVGGENAGGTAAFLFLRQGDAVRAVALSPAGEATALREVGPLDEVVPLERGVDLYAQVAARLAAAKPARIAINASTAVTVADGLSSSQRTALEKALSPAQRKKLVSAEDVVSEWLSVKLPEEVDILRKAAALTSQLEVEAYQSVVPGKTRDVDVARFLKKRMAELGVGDAWAPDQNPNVNSGPTRGHSHATERVIQPGDFIQTDFGIRVGGMWVTDIQRFAYVLAPGETQPPKDALEKWEKGKKGSRIALAALKPGASGWDVDKAQRDWMREAGSEPVMWGTGHPVGYWAHDVGPALSGGAKPRPAKGQSLRIVRPGQVFAFDGFFAWQDGAPDAQRIVSVEEMAVVTETGAEYLIPPQEDLVLIPSAPAPGQSGPAAPRPR
ncbi:aminopeptidase P family protein [Myxococcus llanfairpwllgwyngyllgogerychwyrndrobwllllantysiliogogogochensis]|uniref:Aminopeptidase P family protein n=1 Tax=Myxococcus llanfairpwllgwyngyllgogerychwyrndrobwllllantysiliogogogochensis TaxID=2590453 RepID=A0A540WM59_9BACT|nr:M24 family peptidase [Myxococcus llanfairpwllgwyngyllgogerychwyrndrobwllllantysiliogogogochensis]TQF10098.1 aminopeptidase P family protein [Myxococcus llanfairpwllgwyngyllgogerychwyrndrobwllllantysiliogogogochensis]